MSAAQVIFESFTAPAMYLAQQAVLTLRLGNGQKAGGQVPKRVLSTRPAILAVSKGRQRQFRYVLL